MLYAVSNRKSDSSEEARARAEARFQKAQKADRENDATWAENRAKAQAVDEKTARLKSLRLARDAAEAEAEAQTGAEKKRPRRKKS
jgi:hypothetical protein